MATTSFQSGYLQVILGDDLNFVINQETTNFDPDNYDVFRLDGDGTTTKVTAGQLSMSAVTLTTNDSNNAAATDLFVPQTLHAVTTGNGWIYGDIGIIVAYDDADTANQTHVVPFQVARGAGIEKLTDLQTSDSDSAMLAAPNTILGRLWTVEKNQRDVLMPRQRRMLGLLGEHQVVDAFLYDDDGNITECRLRNFDDKTNAAAAGKWTDRLNQADPRTSPGGDTGEVGVYTITADNLLPRNLRTLFEQKIDADPADNLFGTGTGDGTTGSTV